MEALSSRSQETSVSYSSDSSESNNRKIPKTNNHLHAQGEWQQGGFGRAQPWQQNFSYPSLRQWSPQAQGAQPLPHFQNNPINAYTYNPYAFQEQNVANEIEEKAISTDGSGSRSGGSGTKKSESTLSNPQSNSNTDNSKQIRSERNITKSKENWTVDEIRLLYTVVIKATAIRTPVYYPIVVTDWHKVAKKFENKTAVACEKLWEVINPNCHVRVLENNSVVLCTDVNTPTTKPQVQQNSSKPDCLNDFGQSSVSEFRKSQQKAQWSDEEKKHVHELQKQHGNKWTFISKKLGTGKTPTEVKNFWNNKKYRVLKKLKKTQ